ncbi:YwaF family protein [Mesomycoplasma lagogenitalium]|uniref:YwaF family protein n=1 Tax=Mesomycoplasma lagogenitalium TaxID=171286 RepID=A0ABY8LTV1_9BACT|nr:YwaF family protein [Mesomycoplasma lagogenitalium]WGI36667.1 YwaF family protein [Mesomycoplasma lagogenitalium]
MTFFTWRRNVASFEESKIIFYLFFALVLFSVLILWIYREKINNYFNQKNKTKFLFNKLTVEQIFIVIGSIALFFCFYRIIILIISDYPWKWELLPLHMCRFFIFLLSFLYIFKRGYLVKYFSILAILGGIVGFAFANIGIVEEFIKGDRIYNSFVPGTREYERAGMNVGYDTREMWDFALSHGFVIFMPVFTHIVYGKKAQLTLYSLTRGLIFLFIIGILTFFLNWILNAVAENTDNAKLKISLNANWLYLGKDGINTLGILTQWPYALITFSFLIPAVLYLSYFFYIFLISFKFKFNKYNIVNKIKVLKYKKILRETNENISWKSAFIFNAKKAKLN